MDAEWTDEDEALHQKLVLKRHAAKEHTARRKQAEQLRDIADRLERGENSIEISVEQHSPASAEIRIQFNPMWR